MSEEVNSLVVILGGTLLLFWTFPAVRDGFRNIFLSITAVDCRTSWNLTQISYGTMLGTQFLAILLLPISVGILIFGVIANRSQVGNFFEVEPLRWKLTELNPVTGFKKIIPSMDNTVRLLLVIGKVSIIGIFVFFAIREDYQQITLLSVQPLDVGMAWMLERSAMLIFKILLIFVIIAIIDYLWKRKKYFDNLMMTKQAVKDERKNAEGDILVKGKIRQKMRELTMMRMIVEVPNADVVVTNPIHVAIALRYKPGSAAPLVVARGLRKRATRIKEIAMNANVPVVEDPPLARALYRKTTLGGHIPKELYGAVATVLAKLHQSGKRAFLT